MACNHLLLKRSGCADWFSIHSHGKVQELCMFSYVCNTSDRTGGRMKALPYPTLLHGLCFKWFDVWLYLFLIFILHKLALKFSPDCTTSKTQSNVIQMKSAQGSLKSKTPLCSIPVWRWVSPLEILEKSETCFLHQFSQTLIWQYPPEKFMNRAWGGILSHKLYTHQ